MAVQAPLTVLHLGDPIFYNPEIYQKLSECFKLIRPAEAERNRPAFIEALKSNKYGDFAAIMRPYWSTGGEMGQWDKELIDLLPPSVQVFASAGAGYDWVDVEALAHRGIVYCNGATASSEAVADMAIWHMLSAFRNITWTALAARSLDEDTFRFAHKHVGETAHNPRGHILGIVGLGNIGYTIAKKAHDAFGMHICYHDIQRKDRTLERAISAVFCDSVEELVSEADCVIIATPFTGQKLITRELLQEFKAGSRFINVARGALVDEEALADALDEGRLSAAGLDVHEHEPTVNRRLGSMRNVSLTCHNAGGAIETRAGFERLAMENCWLVLSGLKPHTPVNQGLVSKS
jgi:lactate dehydrogenase-like 2-hydroxyacid dehydrogenase